MKMIFNNAIIILEKIKLEYISPDYFSLPTVFLLAMIINLPFHHLMGRREGEHFSHLVNLILEGLKIIICKKEIYFI
jgi:hypothetical protein